MKSFVMKIREMQEEISQIDSQIAGLNQRKSKLEVILCVLMESTTNGQDIYISFIGIHTLLLCVTRGYGYHSPLTSDAGLEEERLGGQE